MRIKDRPVSDHNFPNEVVALFIRIKLNPSVVKAIVLRDQKIHKSDGITSPISSKGKSKQKAKKKLALARVPVAPLG